VFEKDIIDYMAWQVEHNGMATAAVARSLNKRGITASEAGNGKAIPSPEPLVMTSTRIDSNSQHLIGGGQSPGIELGISEF